MLDFQNELGVLCFNLENSSLEKVLHICCNKLDNAPKPHALGNYHTRDGLEANTALGFILRPICTSHAMNESIVLSM